MKMQVKINNIWQFVFCHNSLCSEPITTDNKDKAIAWHSNSIGYFTRKYANLEFRGIKC